MARSTDWTSSPFALMRQGVDEMDRFFARLVGGSRSGEMPWAGARAATPGDWTPAIEAFQRGNEFVIRADIPGLKRNEITVEAGDDSIVIRGERKQEHATTAMVCSGRSAVTGPFIAWCRCLPERLPSRRKRASATACSRS